MPAAPPAAGHRDRREWIVRALLALFLAAWAAFMFRRLGALSLWMDEGFHYLAARGILEHGYPLYPSGHIYWKAILYAYLLAGGSFLFGLKTVVLRAFSVLCVAGLSALAYHFGRKYFSRTVGFLAAVLLSFSVWEMEYARLALYFAPLQLFYLLSLYFFYRGFVEEEKRFRAWAVVFFLLTPLIHQLGMGIVFAYPALFVIRGPRRFFRRDVLTGLAVTGLFYFAIQIQEFFFWKVGYVYEKTDQSLRGMVDYFFSGFSLDYFTEFYRSFPRMSLAVLAGLILCLGTAAVRLGRRADQDAPGSSRPVWLYLNLCLVFPLFFFAFFRTHVQPRYLAQLYPVFILLFLAVLWKTARGAAAFVGPRFIGVRDIRVRAAVGGLVFAGLLAALTQGVRPDRFLPVINRGYGDPITADTIARSGRFEHYDHEGVGRFVAAEIKPDDIVIAIHVVFQKIYAGRVDYWLWSGGPGTWDAWEETKDGWKDFYVGARYLKNVESLRAVIEANPGRRVWLITSPSMFRNDHINPPLYDYIWVENGDKLVWRGRDGMSEVFVWNDPQLAAGGRRTCEGEWFPSRRGTVVQGAGLSGGAGMSWAGREAKPDDFTARIVRVQPRGSYRASVRYKAGEREEAGAAARLAITDGRGRSLRTIVLSRAERPAGKDGWREAEAEFLLPGRAALGLKIHVPASTPLEIDYVDIRAKEGNDER